MDQEGSWGDDLKDVSAGGDHAVAHFRDGVHERRVVAGRASRSRARSAASTSCTPATTSTATSTALSTIPTTRSATTTCTRPATSRDLFLDNDGNQINPDAASRTTTTTRRRATRSADHHAAGQARARPARLLLPEAVPRLLPGVRPHRGPRGHHADELPGARLAALPGRRLPEQHGPHRHATRPCSARSLSTSRTSSSSRSARAISSRKCTVKGFFGFGLGFNLGTSRRQQPPTTMQPASRATGERRRRRLPAGGPGLVPQRRMALPLAGRPQGRALPERRQGHLRERQRLPREPHLEGDRHRHALCDLVRGLPAGRHQPQSLRRRLHPDFLTNYELGWKTRFADDRLQFNGAVFLEEWDDIQVAFQGGNGITQVDNGRQGARSRASRRSSTGCRPTTSASASRSPTTTAS